MRHRKLLAAVLAAALMGATGLGGFRLYGDRCGAAWTTLDVDDLEPVFHTDDSGDLELWQQRTLDEARALGPPFGEVLGWRFWDHRTRATPSMRPAGEHVALTESFRIWGDAYLESVVAVELPTGTPLWAHGLEYGGAPMAGDVDEVFTVSSMFTDRRPEVAAFDLADGERVTCAKLGDRTNGPGSQPWTAISAEDDLVVAHPRVDGDDGYLSQLTRIDPSTGDEVWTIALDLESVGELHLIDDILLVSAYELASFTPDPLRDDPAPTSPGVFAHSIHDGSVMWSYPPTDPGLDGSSPATKESVVGVDPTTQTIVVESSPFRTANAVVDLAYVGLELDGEVRWDRTIERAAWGTRALWGSTLVTNYSDPDSVLGGDFVGWDLADGAELWSMRLSNDPETAVQIDDDLWLASYGPDLHLIDPTSGASVVYPAFDIIASGTVVLDDHVVLSGLGSMLVLERTEPPDLR